MLCSHVYFGTSSQAAVFLRPWLSVVERLDVCLDLFVFAGMWHNLPVAVKIVLFSTASVNRRIALQVSALHSARLQPGCRMAGYLCWTDAASTFSTYLPI